MDRTRTFLLVPGVVLAGLLMAGTAQAHPPPFYWMPDLSAHSQVGVDLIPGNFDRDGDSALLVPASVFAELAVTDYLVLLARVPFAYVDRVGIVDPDEGAFALGNVGLGLLLADSSRRDWDAWLRYGIGVLVHLPTASDEGDQGAAAARAATFLVPDRGRFQPGITNLRARGDVRYETGRVFMQGEVGIDHQLRDDSDDRTDLLLAAGLGVTLSPYWAVLAELTAVSNILEDEDSELLPVLDAGLRYHDPSLMTGLRVYWPFHESYRDASAIGVGIDLGIRF
jgi:hypothetical protein